MWNIAVSDLRNGLQTAFRPLATMAHEYPTTTLGIALLFTLLLVMLSVEFTHGRALAARAGKAPPIRSRR